MGIKNNFIQHNHLLEHYITDIKEYSYICPEGHLGINQLFDIRNVPKLTDIENDRIFKKYISYLIERKTLEMDGHVLGKDGFSPNAIANQLITGSLVSNDHINCYCTKLF